jgi:hypothetical protein
MNNTRRPLDPRICPVAIDANALDRNGSARDIAGEDGGRILVRVTKTHLYVGNTGAPLSKDGIIALLGANSSRRRRNQTGRFGLGFKSLLALGGTASRQGVAVLGKKCC